MEGIYVGNLEFVYIYIVFCVKDLGRLDIFMEFI